MTTSGPSIRSMRSPRSSTAATTTPRLAREGMEETLTLTRLGVSSRLMHTRESTNPCQSMIEIVRRTQRNVKRRSGEMALRWTAAGMLEADRDRCRRSSATATSAPHRRDRTRPRPSPSRRNRSHPDRGGRYRRLHVVTQPRPRPKFHSERDILSDPRVGPIEPSLGSFVTRARKLAAKGMRGAAARGSQPSPSLKNRRHSENPYAPSYCPACSYCALRFGTGCNKTHGTNTNRLGLPAPRHRLAPAD